MSRSLSQPSRLRDLSRDTARALGFGAASRPSVAEPRRGLSLRAAVALAAGALVFVIAGLLGGLLTQNFAAESRIRNGQSVQIDATRIADQLNKQLAARARELFLLGAFDPLASLHDGRQVQALLTALRASVPAYYWLGLTDTTGHMIASTNPELLGGDFSARPEIREGLRGFSTASEGAGGQAPGHPEPLPMTLSHPVRGADGGIAGVIVAQLQWGWVRELADAVMAPENQSGATRGFVLLNSQDRVLIGPNEALGAPLALSAVARARGGYVGWSAETWPDGKSYLTGAAIVQQSGPSSDPGSVPMQWTVVTREDANAAFNPVRVLRAQVALGGVVLSLMAMALGWLGAGLITQKLRLIADAADRLADGAEGDLPAIERPAEIGALSASLRRMVAAQTTSQVALDTMATIARHDSLTGLMNRDGLRSWLAERMRGDMPPRGGPVPAGQPAAAQPPAARTSGSLLVFLADLDGFKPVNDELGHQAGDAVLVEIAARMSRFMRPNDAIARFGGDEFIIVLDAPKGTADEAAEITIFDMFDAVCLVPCALPSGESVPIGMSLGGAMWPEDGADIDKVIAKADAALLAAKRAGKGRIIMHQPDKPPALPAVPEGAR